MHYDSLFYWRVNKRNEIGIDKAEKKRDILMELLFPNDIYFSPYNKYVLYITFSNPKGNHFMYMGKIQKHIYMKNYPYVGNIECPDITIMDLTDSIEYYWIMGTGKLIYVNETKNHNLRKKCVIIFDEHMLFFPIFAMIICPNRDFIFLSEKKLKSRCPCSQTAFF